MTRACSRCGASFSARSTGGRPRTKCDNCRTNLGKIDGTAWRKLRAQVLREEPVCCVRGCGRQSTQVDHILPLKLAPDLAMVRANLQGMCATHNASKGARVPGPPRLHRDPDRCPCWPEHCAGGDLNGSRHYCCCCANGGH